MRDQPVPGRRGLLKALAVGVPGAAWAPRAISAPDNPPSAPQPDAAANGAAPNRTLKFFNAQEALTMDAIAARLIPADDLGPGAKEAGVTLFLDGQLAGAWGAGSQLYRQGPFEPGTPEQGYQLSFTPAEMFRRGRAALDAAARKADGKPFA
ncbi:gluconate 2-dehydrogenase subunit 3 family protein, partial [Achromobacter mucicolens]|uniref:gluconate 2-dehydrogenase subunit 3 family protein n=1 Tax=Achromobacter mucicolens TaxID=1389922 RepID=UPI0028A73D6F